MVLSKLELSALESAAANLSLEEAIRGFRQAWADAVMTSPRGSSSARGDACQARVSARFASSRREERGDFSGLLHNLRVDGEHALDLAGYAYTLYDAPGDHRWNRVSVNGIDNHRPARIVYFALAAQRIVRSEREAAANIRRRDCYG